MSFVLNELMKLKDEKNADFQAKLTPTISADKFLGTRVPMVRTFAKEVEKHEEYESFMNTLPHEYYDENILHSILLSRVKPFDKCIKAIEAFLPYVDNWAVCDIIKPKVFEKNKEDVLSYIKSWIASDAPYTIRFGVSMLMTYFLDADFKPEFLEIPARIKSDEYYVNMMIAWYYATALAKQWESTVPYIENHVLSDWTHRKTIQKACESLRVSKEQKEYLKSLK